MQTPETLHLLSADTGDTESGVRLRLIFKPRHDQRIIVRHADTPFHRAPRRTRPSITAAKCPRVVNGSLTGPNTICLSPLGDNGVA